MDEWQYKNLPEPETSVGHFVFDFTTHTIIFFFNVSVQKIQLKQVCTLTWVLSTSWMVIVLLNLNCKVSWCTTHLLFKTIQLYPYTETMKAVSQKHDDISHWNTLIQFKTQVGLKGKQILKLHYCGSWLKVKPILPYLKATNISFSEGIVLCCF